MKNITFLTVLVTIFLLSVNNPVFSQIQPDNLEESKYAFSVGTHFGFVYGQSLEYVYPGTRTKAELLSELRWDMKPVYYLGLQASYERDDLTSKLGFFSSLSFRIGIPGDSGIHENRDWMSTVNTGLTHFSTHTNETREFFWADLMAGISLPVNQALYAKLFLNASWMHFAFTGKGGMGTYARKSGCLPGCTLSTHVAGCTSNRFDDYTTYFPIDENPHIYPYSGNVIRYQQDWFLIAAGFTTGFYMPYPFSMILSFQISPLTFCFSKDEHLTTKITYLDNTYFGLFLQQNIKFSFAVKRFSFSLEGAYRYIGKTRGPSYSNTVARPLQYNYNGEAGAGLSLADVSLLVNFKF